MTKTELQSALAEATQTDKRTAGAFLDTLSTLTFRAYFTEGRDVGRHDVLSEIAAEVGLPQAEARSFLVSDHIFVAIAGEAIMQPITGLTRTAKSDRVG